MCSLKESKNIRKFFLKCILVVLVTLHSVAHTQDMNSKCVTESKMMNANETLPNEISITLNKAEHAMSHQDWISANNLLDEGILKMGNKYLTSNLIDETGIKLITANLEEQKGNLQNAISIKFKILSSRLTLFCEKKALEK